MNKIYLTGLETEAIIGVYPHEKIAKQKLIIDLEFATDTAQISTTDNLADAVDYDQVISFIDRYLAETAYNLVETLAHKLASELLFHFKFTWLRLKLAKPNASQRAHEIGVIIELC